MKKLIVGVLLTACSVAADTPVIPEEARIAKLHVVDCLLPGQVRQLGRRTFLSPRRPIKTTAAECEIRGGEYVAFDRANYKTALKVWMSSAQSGDAEAQTNVGEIFEKGLGTEPNYEAAIAWYRKAAEQGNTRAQFNLGTLYEQGLGVPASKVEALNWYRKAWGMSEDELMFSSAAAREQDELREELARSIQEKDAQLELLKKQVGELKKQLDEAVSSESAVRASLQTQAQTLETLIAQLETQKQTSEQELAAIPPETGLKTRQPVVADVAEARRDTSGVKEASYKDLNLGRYFALLIGNSDYTALENLDTPLNDIQRAEKVLEEKYGFTVMTIANSNNVELMESINDLNEILDENDNLLLFYAGHGNRLQTGEVETGYWLPSNADAPPRNSFWVANEFVTGHLGRLKAKRILVVADSCYAGLLSSEPSFLLLGDNAPSYSNLDFLQFKASKRARLLLASGGDKPVLDGGGDGHSVFARAFLEELEGNDGLLAAPDLYLRVRDRVADAASDLEFEQKPDFKTIRSAGHEVGDFFFVPLAAR